MYLLWIFVLGPFFNWVGSLAPLLWLILQIILVILAIGAISFFIYQVYGYIQFKRRLPYIRAEKERERLRNQEYERIGLQRRNELVTEGIEPIKKDILYLGKLKDDEFSHFKEEQKIAIKFRKIGYQRRKELETQGITENDHDDEELGELSEYNYQLLKDEQKRKKEEKERELEKERKEREQKLKEQQLEVSIVLTRVKKCKYEELEDLNDEQKNYLLKRWEKEINELFKNGNKSDEIISFLCGKENARIKTRHIIDDESEQETGDKFERVVETIENYTTPRIIRDERELETAIYEHLRLVFPQPQYSVEFQKRIEKGKVDIVIDDEIAIELKIADNRGNLNQLFAQIEWYKGEYEQLILVILDLDRVSDIEDFVQKFKERGATVICLSEENIRFKRSK